MIYVAQHWTLERTNMIWRTGAAIWVAAKHCTRKTVEDDKWVRCRRLGDGWLTKATLGNNQGSSVPNQRGAS